MRLLYCLHHQKELKACKYRVISDAMTAQEVSNLGGKIILPPTFTGSPRYFMKAYQDCMAIVR